MRTSSVEDIPVLLNHVSFILVALFVFLQDGIPQVYYLLGKALVYLGESWSHSSLTTAEKEFKSGSTLSCSYATFELWKMNYRNKVSHVTCEMTTNGENLYISIG